MSRKEKQRISHHGPPHLMAGEKPKDFKGSFRRLLGYLKPMKIRLLIVFFAAIFSTVFSILGPFIVGKSITVIFDGFMGLGIDFSKVAKYLIFLGCLYLFSSLFTFIQQYLMASVAQTTVYDLREEVFQKVGNLPLKYFDSHSHGDTLSRVTNDLDTIANTLQQSITQFLTAFITMVGIIVMMFVISPTLTLIALVSLPLSIFVIRPIIQRSQKYFSKQQNTLGSLNGHIEEMYTGHSVVKAFGKEEKTIEVFYKINDELYEAGRNAQFISGIIHPLMGFIGNISYVLISIFGGLFVIKRLITVGDIQAFITYSRQFNEPIMQIANIANIIQATIAAAERVFELLDETEETKETPKVTLEHPKGNIAFEAVDFGYDEDLLIENMNVNVQAGQTVAIVGPTGAGKTTLINLMMRFYELKGGKITIDGINITDLKRSDLRRLFGMVLQDTWLFNGTIRENIAYGKKDATEEEIIAAAKAAGADHFIRTLPEGYDTILDEEASNISQGQKQLITIARAILADSPMMILDEATSNVDTRTELLIQQAMNRLMENRTSFVIAHRLSTIQDADLILVMDKGKIIEQGTHEQLLEQKGFYADLYESQFDHQTAG